MTFNSVYALGLVLAFALPTFWLIRPLMVPVMGETAFTLRRNAWLFITVLAFLAPNFWVYAIAIGIYLSIIRSREGNPVAMFLMLMYAAPVRGVEIPRLGSIALIGIDHITLLLLLLLLPALLNERRKEGNSHRNRGFDWILGLMLAFCFIQIAFWAPVESLTHSLRRAVVSLLNTVLLYVCVARLTKSRETTREALYGLLAGTCLMAAIAIPEVFKGWQFYTDVGDRWAPADLGTYITRGEFLRALGATDTPIAFGHFCAGAFIIALMVLDNTSAAALRQRAWIVLALLMLGLFLAKSRAPWLSGAVAFALYIWLTPSKGNRMTTLMGSAVLLVLVGSFTPYGQKIIDFLPFVGTTDSTNIDYRASLQRVLWQLTLESPWTGNPFLLNDLKSFKQGQGIVDLLNVYLVFGASFGLPGALTFIGCLLIGLQRTRRLRQQAVAEKNPADIRLAATLSALLLAHILLMITMSYVTTIATWTWILLGLIACRSEIRPAKLPSQTLR